MKSRELLLIIAIAGLLLNGCKQEVTVAESKLTGINPLSYTDVVYMASRDTVLVSTFSGRIAQRIKGNENEEVIAQLSDEIHGLAYDQKNQLIYATTLQSGIVIIDLNTKSIVDSLPVSDSWISEIYLSKNGEILGGYSAHRENFLWNLKSKTLVELPESLNSFRIAGMDEKGYFLLKGNGKFVTWNPDDNQVEKEISLTGSLKDIDDDGNMLLFLDKEFQFYSGKSDSVAFRKQHPDWPYFVKEQEEAIRIPLQLSLTVGQLTEKYIFTAGVDRSIRKWSLTDGELVKDILDHKATISAMDCAENQSQIVSVDLKGGIVFSEVNSDD